MNAQHVCAYYAYVGLAYLDKKVAGWPLDRLCRAILCTPSVQDDYTAIQTAVESGNPETVKHAMRAYWTAVLAVE